MKPIFIILITTLFILLMEEDCAINSGITSMADNRITITAPEFPDGLDWINVDKPLRLSSLRGKIVLLDFWTYCCINCMHIIPDLKRLEAKYPNELVIIGVHSAKFSSEQETENIRQAVLRYDIEHPVVNDKDLIIWNNYVAKAWPTLVLINPKGKIAGYRSGEGIYNDIDLAIQDLLKKYTGEIDHAPIRLSLEKNKIPKTLLKFPGKITADERSKKLIISDSNNNRVIITDFDGHIIDVIGSGKKGKNDGSFEETEFFDPQGTVLANNYLYIADTDNHLIRRADLINRKVETIAGIGKQVYQRNPIGDARKVGLNSPWDLTIVDSVLYIAMAGQHQIWALDLKTNRIRIHAGSGYENIVDNDLKSSAFAQPSGITTDGQVLYIADSEVSGVRRVDTNLNNGKVITIIGKGLFDFGDVDGKTETARLQHPLGIVFVKGKLFVADTYNNKIKVIDPIEMTSKTLAGTGKEGMDDGAFNKASFNEPGGLSYAEGRLYIADTDNNLIRIIDENQNVSTLVLKNIDKLKKKERFDRINFRGDVVRLDDANLNRLKELDFKFTLPDGYKLNLLAPNHIKFYSPAGEALNTVQVEDLNINVKLSHPFFQPNIYAEAVIYYCRKDNEGLCLIKDLLFEINHTSNTKNERSEITYKIMQ